VLKLKFILLFLVLIGNITSNSRAEFPQRIVSLAPHISEMVFKLGAGDRLIGRTDFCNYPTQAEQIESVGGYLNIDFEKLVSLKPDLVLQFPNAQNKQKLETLGFRVEDIPNETIDNILNSIIKIGKIIGLEHRARQVCDGINDTLKMVQNRGDRLSGKLTALLLVGRERQSLQGLYASGKSTYLGEIWELCGGTVAFREMNARYFAFSKEDLIKKKIDVILEFHRGWNLNQQDLQKEKSVWNVFSNLGAVNKGNIFIFNDDFFLVPGPRVTRIALRFSQILEQVNEEAQ
jgi:iron complex transport system substrate-binding protein